MDDGLSDLFGAPSASVNLTPVGDNLLDFDDFNPDFRKAEDVNPNAGLPTSQGLETQSAPHERRSAATSAPDAVDPEELRRRISGQSGGNEKGGVLALVKAKVVEVGGRVVAWRPTSVPDFRSISRCSSRLDDDESKSSRCQPLRDRFAANPKIAGFAAVTVVLLVAGCYVWQSQLGPSALGAELSDEVIHTGASEFVEVAADDGDDDEPPVRTIDDPITTTRPPKKKKKDGTPPRSEAGSVRGGGAKAPAASQDIASDDIAALRKSIEDGNKGLREEIAMLREEVAMLTRRSGEGRPERRTAPEPDPPAFRGSDEIPSRGRGDSSDRGVPRMEDPSKGRSQRPPDDGGRERGVPRMEGSSDGSKRQRSDDDDSGARRRSDSNAGEVHSESQGARPAFQRGQTQSEEPSRVGDVHFPA